MEEEESIQYLTKNEIKSAATNIGTVYSSYLKKNKINLYPNYQRSFCWTYDQCNKFLNSVWYCPIIPSIVIYKKEDSEITDKDKHTHECVDGRHRLLTLQMFIENISYDDIKKENSLYDDDEHNFVDGENKKYLYVEDKNVEKTKTIHKIYYDTIPTKFKKYSRLMTESEKDTFEDTEIFTQTINMKLNYRTKCCLFNGLQNGSRVGGEDKFKNIFHQVPNFLREHSITNKSKKKDIRNEWKSIIKLDNDKAKGTCSKDNFIGKITCLIIRLMYMEERQFDVNFLDLNLRKYIENNYKSATINKEIGGIYKKVIEKKDKIKKTVPSLICKSGKDNKCGEIICEYYYLLHCLDFSAHDDLEKHLIDKKILEIYNETTTYKKIDKIVGKEKMLQTFLEFEIDLYKLENKNIVFIDELYSKKKIGVELYCLLYYTLCPNNINKYKYLSKQLDEDLISKYNNINIFDKIKGNATQTNISIMDRLKNWKAKLEKDLNDYKQCDKIISKKYMFKEPDEYGDDGEEI